MRSNANFCCRFEIVLFMPCTHYCTDMYIQTRVHTDQPLNITLEDGIKIVTATSTNDDDDDDDDDEHLEQKSIFQSQHFYCSTCC